MGRQLAALGGFLIRTESVASSKIEQIDASIEDFARALIGIKSNDSATSMVAAIGALTALIEKAGNGKIALADILEAHRQLMFEDPVDAETAGELRTVQNWIGGSDYSPRGALYVPPPHELVEELMADLVAFVNRDDVPALAQAALAHAQFESIHPFVDGNGRIGRALINAVLRRRGVTTTTVIPIASVVVADRERYFALLDEYRLGNVDELIHLMCVATSVASTEAEASASVLAAMPEAWRSAVRPRKSSATDRMLDLMLDLPVFSVEQMVQRTGISQASVYQAVERLEQEAIVYEITGRRRDRVWAANDVLEELDALNARVAKRVKPGSEV
jgi:Fic family protein